MILIFSDSALYFRLQLINTDLGSLFKNRTAKRSREGKDQSTKSDLKIKLKIYRSSSAFLPKVIMQKNHTLIDKIKKMCQCLFKYL